MKNNTQKEVIRAKVTQEDIDKATSNIGKLFFSYINCCVVYQVAKRMGMNPMRVMTNEVFTMDKEKYSLDDNGSKITSIHFEEWQNSLNIEFTFTKE